MVERVKFDSLFTFIYSPRKGTKAAALPDPISAEEKGRWFRELLDVQEKMGENAYNRYVGRTFRVLCEGEGRTDASLLNGKTPQDVIVDFDGDRSLIGKFVNVKIEKALNWALIGKIV